MNNMAMTPNDSDSHHHHAHHHGHHLHGAVKGISWALGFNLVFAVVELVGGFLSGSALVVGNALHDFGDVLTLGFSLVLEKYSHKGSNSQYSYGFRRLSLLATLWSGFVLALGSVLVIFWAVQKLIAGSVEVPKIEIMLPLAILGILINFISFQKLHKGSSQVESMLKLHFLEDIGSWIVVLVSAVTLSFFSWPWLDPILAIFISLWILKQAIQRSLSGLGLLLQSSPQGLKDKDLVSAIKEIPGVVDAHHLHVWSLEGEHHILTAHVVVEEGLNPIKVGLIKTQVKKILKERFHIIEATIETEFLNDLCLDPVHS